MAFLEKWFFPGALQFLACDLNLLIKLLRHESYYLMNLLVQEHADYDTERCHAFVCDVTERTFVFPFPDESLDIIILIFVLSAIHPDK